MKKVIEYVREDEKKHSVRYAEVVPSAEQTTGTIYVKRSSGLTGAKRLRVTIEEVES